MAEKPQQQFGTRIPIVTPPSAPAKRSGHVALLVMGTIAVGSTAYILMPRECTPAQPGTMPMVSSPAECPPRGSSSSSHGGSGGSSSRSGYYSSDSSSHSSSGTTSDSGGVQRGGFGSFAHGFTSHFSGGG